MFPATVSAGYSNMPASNDGSPTMNRGMVVGFTPAPAPAPAPAPFNPPFAEQYGFQPSSGE